MVDLNKRIHKHINTHTQKKKKKGGMEEVTAFTTLFNRVNACVLKAPSETFMRFGM